MSTKLEQRFKELTDVLISKGFLTCNLSEGCVCDICISWRRLKEQINTHRNLETALKELIKDDN